MLLVTRNFEGEVRWMEVCDWLKRASENGTEAVKQIVFEGERFDVMSVRTWPSTNLRFSRPFTCRRLSRALLPRPSASSAVAGAGARKLRTRTLTRDRSAC